MVKHSLHGSSRSPRSELAGGGIVISVEAATSARFPVAGLMGGRWLVWSIVPAGVAAIGPLMAGRAAYLPPSESVMSQLPYTGEVRAGCDFGARAMLDALDRIRMETKTVRGSFQALDEPSHRVDAAVRLLDQRACSLSQEMAAQ